MHDRVERQLSDELHQIAASANPPADAWERFSRRVGDSPADVTPEPPLRLVLADPETGDEIDGHQQSTAMEFTMQTNETTSRPRRRLLLGAVAAVAVLAVAGIAVAVGTRDDGDVDVAEDQVSDASSNETSGAGDSGTPAPASDLSTIEVSGVEDDDVAAAAAEVDAAYEAFNAGDPWLIPTGGRIITAGVETPDELGNFFEFEYAVGAAKADVSCDYLGVVKSPQRDRAADEPPTAHQFECSDNHTNALMVAAGVEVAEIHRWWVDDGRVVYATKQPVADDSSEPYDRFLVEYVEWLLDAHPDVAETLSISSPDSLDFFSPSAEDAPVLLDYLDEFVEQSDDWPVEGG